MDLAALFTAENAVALLTLTGLEIVLGIDNIVFIAILAGKLPPEQRNKARVIGLALAAVTRLLLLFTLSWLVTLTKPLITVQGFELSGKDLILGVGGLFLIAKATFEIHGRLEGEPHHEAVPRHATLTAVIIQILLVDMVFSLDSVITAVGMSNQIPVMAAAVIISVGVMIAFSGSVTRFIDKHPTLKMLALSFLLLIGVMLVVEAGHGHIPKGYIYAAMAFSLFVEMLNIRSRRARTRGPGLPAPLQQKAGA